MEINNAGKQVLLTILKQFSEEQTITSLAQAVRMTRPGAFKVVKRLEEEGLVTIKALGKGRTSTALVKINWENPLIGKLFSLFLAEEANEHLRWQNAFKPTGNLTEFCILFGSVLKNPKEARDIDLLCILSGKERFIRLEKTLQEIQKTELKKIHAVQFTPTEFRSELKNRNPAFIDAVKKGIILYGQEKFIAFMKEFA